MMDKAQMEITHIKARVMVLCSACHLMLIDIYIKFREDSLNGFQVTEHTRLCDKVPREITQKL